VTTQFGFKRKLRPNFGFKLSLKLKLKPKLGLKTEANLSHPVLNRTYVVHSDRQFCYNSSA